MSRMGMLKRLSNGKSLKRIFCDKKIEITDDMIQAIANSAIREAQRKSLENGIPNVYSKNGILYFQLPDGTITMENPFEKVELKERLDALTGELTIKNKIEDEESD